MAMVVDAGVAGAMAAPSRQMAAVATASSSSSSCVVGMGVRSLPVCRGLRRVNLGVKVSSRVAVRSAAAASSSSSSSSSSRGNIVSEAQETVTGVAGVVNESTWPNLVLESDIPVLVDFWAPWCGPCRMIAPLIDDIAKQYAGKVRCLKLNTDESPGIATEYGIRSIPTVMIFTKGVKRDSVIGAVPKTALTTTLDKYLE